MVHSLFAATDDWDDQLEGFESGWPAFFEVLRVYLAHFAGRKAASFNAIASDERALSGVWKQLTDKLGLAAANVGEERTTPQQPESLSGVVERVQQDTKQRYIMLRLNAPAPGIALIGTYGTDSGTNASMVLYYYGDDAEQRAAASEPRWRHWFGENFERPWAATAGRGRKRKLIGVTRMTVLRDGSSTDQAIRPGGKGTQSCRLIASCRLISSYAPQFLMSSGRIRFQSARGQFKLRSSRLCIGELLVAA